MCQRKSKQADRWQMKDQMLALSIFFHSQKAYKLLSGLFIMPSKAKLLHSLQKLNMKHGFNESIQDALAMKAKVMDNKDCNVALIFDEMSIKQSLIYNYGSDKI